MPTEQELQSIRKMQQDIRKMQRELYPKEEAELDDTIRRVREEVSRGGMPQELIDKFFPEPKD